MTIDLIVILLLMAVLISGLTCLMTVDSDPDHLRVISLIEDIEREEELKVDKAYRDYLAYWKINPEHSLYDKKYFKKHVYNKPEQLQYCDTRHPSLITRS